MDNNSSKKIELIQKIRHFMYDSKFQNLGIFSKQYLSSVLYSIYENNQDSLFSLAFGDFDGLRDINDKFSISVGDQTMKNSIALIKSILPADTIISRAAGDEFVILSNSLSKKDFEKQISEINYTFDEYNKQDPNYLHGINITLSALDSNTSTSFEELYNLTEYSVSLKKKEYHNKQFISNEEVLSKKILSNFRSYFNYYRLNEGSTNKLELPKEYFNILVNSLIDIIINTFEDMDTPLDLYMEKLNNSLQSKEIFLNYLPISSKSAKAIHTCTTNKSNYSELDKINIDDLQKVLQFLIREPLTGEYAKNYFKNYLCNEISKGPQKDISVQMFDLVHLKLSNDTITHVKTDQKISELFGSIISTLKQKINYSENSGNYLVSYGGKLISIESGDFTLSEQESLDIIAKSKANQRILDLVTSRISGTNNNLSNIITNLSEQCINQKHELKIKKITSKETVIPLKLAITDTIEYFKDNFKDPYSISSKQYLFSKLYTGMVTVISERFKQMPSSNLNFSAKDHSDLEEP